MSSAVKKTVADCPELLKQWDYERNGDLKPEDVTAGSHKKVHWKCNVVEDHKWETGPNSRTNNSRTNNGNGCPCCRGLKVVPSNCLETTHPEIAAQWDCERNGDLRPEDVTAGSDKKVHWKCPVAEDHRWQAKVASRTNNGNGCACCAGRKAVPSNCLATTHPDIAAQWDYEKNRDLKPSDITAGSGKKVHWKCNVAEDHRWEAQVASRTNEQGCPCCAGKKVVLSNCLATTHPEIAAQWDYERNGDLKPEDVTAGTGKKVHWKCNVAEDHRWEAQVASRTNIYSGGSGCSCCAGKKVVLSNCLATTHPEIAAQWDYERNGDLKPEDVTAGTGKKVHWKCNVAEDHRWETSPNRRTSENGRDCPACAEYGFNPQEKAMVYLMQQPDKMKIGITNLYGDVCENSRIKKHQGNGWTLVDCTEFNNGRDALNLEQSVLAYLDTNNIGRGRAVFLEAFDGYTECWRAADYSPKTIAEIVAIIGPPAC